MQKQLTISWLEFDVWWKVDFIWQLVMTSSVVGLRRSSKALPKRKLERQQKKIMITLWWSAASLIHYSFPNPGETTTSENYAQQIDEMHQNCNACSQHWSIERVQFFSTTPDYTLHNKCFKSWTNWATNFYPILHFHLTSYQPTNYHFFKHLDDFLQGKCFHK